MRTRGYLWPLAAIAGLLAGCASNEIPPPRAELARAELAVDQAVQSDATQLAPLPLQEARKNLDEARIQMEREQYTAASRLAEKAEVNAQLALADAQAKQSEQLAQETLRGIETLREEINRQETSQ